MPLFLRRPQTDAATPWSIQRHADSLTDAKRFGSPLSTQPALPISQPGDACEQEADRIADQVMRIPDSALQRSFGTAAQPQTSTSHAHTPAWREAIEPSLTTLGASEAPPIVHEVLDSPGQPLAAQTRAFFEPRFGYDFSHVRVHADVKAADSARPLAANAYTLGGHIAFAESRYAVGTEQGRALIAHELVHVMQQCDKTKHASARSTVPSPETHVGQHTGISLPRVLVRSEQPREIRRYEAKFAYHLLIPHTGSARALAESNRRWGLVGKALHTAGELALLSGKFFPLSGAAGAVILPLAWAACVAGGLFMWGSYLQKAYQYGFAHGAAYGFVHWFLGETRVPIFSGGYLAGDYANEASQMMFNSLNRTVNEAASRKDYALIYRYLDAADEIRKHPVGVLQEVYLLVVDQLGLEGFVLDAAISHGKDMRLDPRFLPAL